MNKNIKRRMYALALASIMVLLPKTKGYAEDVDMSNIIDIDKAISELVPDDVPVTEPQTPETQPKEEEKTSGLIKPEENKENTNNKPESKPENKSESKPESKSESKPETSANNNVNNNNSNITNNNNANNDNNQNNEISQMECEHTFNDVADDVINQVTPSCTNGGSYDEIYYCTKCGATKLVHYDVPAPGHNWGAEHRENETTAGYEIVRECTNKGCNEIYKEYFHKPTEPTITPTEPTVPSPKPIPGKQDIPKTNDSSHIELAGAIMGLSTLGLPIALYNLKNELEKEAIAKEKSYKGKYLSKK